MALLTGETTRQLEVVALKAILKLQLTKKFVFLMWYHSCRYLDSHYSDSLVC